MFVAVEFGALMVQIEADTGNGSLIGQSVSEFGSVNGKCVFAEDRDRGERERDIGRK